MMPQAAARSARRTRLPQAHAPDARLRLNSSTARSNSATRSSKWTIRSPSESRPTRASSGAGNGEGEGYRSAEQMCKSGLPSPGLAGQLNDDGTAFPLHQAFQRRFDFEHVGEGAQAAGTTPELAGRLRPAQHQLTEDPELLRRKAQRPEGRITKIVLILRDTAAISRFLAHEMPLGERVQCPLHAGLVQLHDGIAIALLITRVGQCVQRQGVLIGRGDGLFDQAGDDPCFLGGEHYIRHLVPRRVSASDPVMRAITSLYIPFAASPTPGAHSVSH